MDTLPAELVVYIADFLPRNSRVSLSSMRSEYREIILSLDQRMWLKQRATTPVHELLDSLEPRQYLAFRSLFSHTKLGRLSNPKVIGAVYDLEAVFSHLWQSQPWNTLRDILINDEERLIRPVLEKVPTLSVIHLICEVYEETKKWPLKCFLQYLSCREELSLPLYPSTWDKTGTTRNHNVLLGYYHSSLAAALETTELDLEPLAVMDQRELLQFFNDCWGWSDVLIRGISKHLTIRSVTASPLSFINSCVDMSGCWILGSKLWGCGLSGCRGCGDGTYPDASWLDTLRLMPKVERMNKILRLSAW